LRPLVMTLMPSRNRPTPPRTEIVVDILNWRNGCYGLEHRNFDSEQKQRADSRMIRRVICAARIRKITRRDFDGYRSWCPAAFEDS
jgi:hypothetical protein